MLKFKQILLLIVLSIGFVMAVLDTTGVVLAVPEIKNFMEVSLSNSIWIINAYILALGSLLLLAGNLATKFGAKRILVLGMSIFTLASVGCSLASNIFMLISLRLIQGFGAALFMPASLTLLFLAYPEAKKRAQMLGIWSAIISVATGAGSFIGGTMISFFGWKSIFLINVPLGILSIIFISILVEKTAVKSDVKIDVFDNLLLILTLGSAIIYLVEGNNFGYDNLKILLFLLLTIIFAVILVVREKSSKNPIIPVILVRNKSFLMANFLGFLTNISLYGIVLVLGLYFQNFRQLSPMISGLVIFPGMAVIVIGNLVYARLIKRFSLSNLTSFSLIATIIAVLILTIFSSILQPLPIGIFVLFFAFMSFGIGILSPATTTLIMETAGKEFSGIAGATLNANKQIGGLFGTALMTIVLVNFSANWNFVLTITFFINIVIYVICLMSTKKTAN